MSEEERRKEREAKAREFIRNAVAEELAAREKAEAERRAKEEEERKAAEAKSRKEEEEDEFTVMGL